MISTWLLANIGVPVLKYGAMTLAVLGLVFGVRRWGMNVEKTELLQQNLRNQKSNLAFAGSVNPTTSDDFLRPPGLRKR